MKFKVGDCICEKQGHHFYLKKGVIINILNYGLSNNYKIKNLNHKDEEVMFTSEYTEYYYELDFNYIKHNQFEKELKELIK